MRTVIDGAAAYERDLIKARTKAALAAKRAKGERIGGVPYGFTLAPNGRQLVEDPEEQATIMRAKQLTLTGLSLRGIARLLAAEGRYNRHGCRFDAVQIMRLLRREEGTHVAASEIVPAPQAVKMKKKPQAPNVEVTLPTSQPSHDQRVLEALTRTLGKRLV